MAKFQRIGPESDKILRNLYEHYVHDMSEWLGIETQNDGSFSYDTSALWSDDVAIYLAKADEKLAGFAVVTSAKQWLGTQDSRDVKDFFVLRAHRHHGIADGMARFIWNQFPAQWLVRVLTTNKPAVPFWRRLVSTYTNAAHQERTVTENRREWIHLHFDNSLS